ncbi:MAG: hypothetical protein A2269_07210 [Lentisphaerae bacterium RIFOXYA12_FULL_60_10]|nr:MAG: hypothetical protein A2269_07210 [Lentisphaerae bacterium RIFOXYA12_FULL_60_10]
MAGTGQTMSSAVEFLQRFQQRVVQDHIPVSASMALTHRCALQCRFCYCRGAKLSRAEASADSWCRWLDEAVDAGCLHLLLTGGDPMIRADFPRIYQHARSKGLLVTVFASGLSVSDEVLAVFADYPPTTVEVSVYGASEDTYRNLTGLSDAWKRVCHGLDRLAAAKVRLHIKTLLMKENQHEFTAIESMARAYGSNFRFDACLFPTLGGDPSPLKQRVPPEQAVELEFLDPERCGVWSRFAQGQSEDGTDDRLYQCGAGTMAFHIDPDGMFRPCLMVRDFGVNLHGVPLASAWKETLAHMQALRMPPDMPCRGCDKQAYCGYCPAYFQVETGDPTRRVDYMCEIGHLRWKKIHATI